MIDAKFLRDHFTIVHLNDKPAPAAHHVDPEQIEWILEAMFTAVARLRGKRDPMADGMAAADLACAAAELRELMGVDK